MSGQLSSKMRYDLRSISQADTFYNEDSYITLLRPRDGTGTAAGSTAPSDMFSTFKSFPDPETWFHRVKLAFRVFSFCLGPANVWRFPEQSLKFGNASYVYLYLAYTALFSTSLLVFELSLSQYFYKGFAKILAFCPALEGITLAMVLYCIMANLVYNVVMMYSLVYVFTAWSKRMSHSYCSERLKEHGCDESANLTRTPEQLYLDLFVNKFIDIEGGDQYNYRNATILVLVYTFLGLILIFGLFKNPWIPIVMSSSTFLILLYVAVVSSTTKGALQGLSRMFIPTKNDLGNLKTWVYPFEQTIVTLGVGTGPLTTFWTISTIKYWSRYDCMIINVFVVLSTLLAGIIMFSAAGVAARENNSTIDAIVALSREEVGTFVIVTKLFNSMSSGLGKFTLFLYYLMLFCTCFFTTLEYTQIILHYISTYISFKRHRRETTILVCSVLCIFITNIDVTKLGYPLMMAINEFFIGTALLIILFFEFSSASYYYGMTTFCDDIEFMLSFLPHYYFKSTWYLLPVLFLFFFVASLFVKFQEKRNEYETVALSLSIVLTLVPIFGVAASKIAKRRKRVTSRRSSEDGGPQ